MGDAVGVDVEIPFSVSVAVCERFIVEKKSLYAVSVERADAHTVDRSGIFHSCRIRFVDVDAVSVSFHRLLNSSGSR